MTPYYEDTQTVLYNGDCTELLRCLSEHAIDACVCDPPYGLEFMGNDWDRLDTPDGFRRKNNPADASRDSVFGRVTKTSPEYTTGNGRFSRPGIGVRGILLNW
jgi:site-specific DNA-methyltransferase (adenine-specific)